MDKNVIHLLTSNAFIEAADVQHSNIILDIFVQACKALDVSLLEPYMDEDDFFADKEKYLFLAELKEMFDIVRQRVGQDYTVQSLLTKCEGCKWGKPVLKFLFYRANQKVRTDFFGFAIIKKNGVLQDIFRGNLFDEFR